MADFSGKGYQAITSNPNLWHDISAFWKKMTSPILASVARVTLQTASRYSPPGRNHKLGFATIPDKMYYCRIINIYAIALEIQRRKKIASLQQKGQKVPKSLSQPRSKVTGLKIKNLMQGDLPPLYEEDWEAIRKGYKYLIITNKYNMKPQKKLGYAKSMGQAKKMARIVNRGIAKYSWSTLLNGFQEPDIVSNDPLTVEHTDFETVKTFNTLERKSPNIARYTWGSMKYDGSQMKNLKWSIEGTTRMNASEPYTPIAIKMGMLAGAKHWKSMLTAIATQNTKSFKRF